MRFISATGFWLACWVTCVGLYLLFAAKWSGEEALVGSVAAALATTGAAVTAMAGRLHFRPRLGWLPLLVRLPIRVLADCGIVGMALWWRITGLRTVKGSFRTVPFDPGGDDGESAARRALVTAGVSLAPNTYVVAVDRQRGLLLVHQLVPSSEPPGRGDREWPL